MLYSDSYSDSMEDDNSENENAVRHKGRRNIRDIKKTEDLSEKTRAANRDEEQRRERVSLLERKFQQVFAEAFPDSLSDQLILDFDFETKTPSVKVHEDLVKQLKNHQKDGVKFMWNACYESVAQAKKSEGSGCVIAHCMGLGKTFQVIALVHTLLNHPNVGTRTVLICCPKNTLLNWVNEFKIWITPNLGEINVFNPTRHDNHTARLMEINRWQSEGGVCIINYELMRILLEDETKDTRQFPLRQRKKFHEALCNPGADLVICDEGHVLKNEETKLSKVMSKVKTLRRIILTGTPMQNNLKEYHCMIQFVKPNLLGSRTEFLNMFVNPILNGQYENSLPHDVQLMKERSHVLHKTLSGCVQRFDLTTLTKYLPEKQEYVIALRLTDCQISMYQYYLDNYSAKGNPDYKNNSSALFADHQALQRIYTHPYSLKLHRDKKMSEPSKPNKLNARKKKKRYSDGEEDDSSGTEYSDTLQRPLSWWMRFVSSDEIEDARTSSKLIVLLEILKECENNGEKLLVFSGSLYSINMIEHFLRKISLSQFEDPSLCNMTSTWEKDQDYFVLTGQTSSEDREKFCKSFNNVHDMRPRLFLISTKAGGIGINLTAANRAVIFDVSWNPSYDVQSIFRIYRIGQSKPCFVYRFLASGTMEEKIYERQVTKQSISHRVVDEKQIARHYTETELQELYQFEPDKYYLEPSDSPKDAVLRKVLRHHKELIGGYHEHCSSTGRRRNCMKQKKPEPGRLTKKSKIPIVSKDLSDSEKSMLEQIGPSSFDPSYLKEVLRRKYKDAFDEEIDVMIEQLLPRIDPILQGSDFQEVMKREALYSRNKRMAIQELERPKISGYGIDVSMFSNSTNNNDDTGLNNDPFSNVLSFGKKNNYFSTKKRGKSRKVNSSTFSLSRGFNSNNSNRSRPIAQPLKVWGSVAGREYGSPERDDDDDDDDDGDSN